MKPEKLEAKLQRGLLVNMASNILIRIRDIKEVLKERAKGIEGDVRVFPLSDDISDYGDYILMSRRAK